MKIVIFIMSLILFLIIIIKFKRELDSYRMQMKLRNDKNDLVDVVEKEASKLIDINMVLSILNNRKQIQKELYNMYLNSDDDNLSDFDKAYELKLMRYRISLYDEFIELIKNIHIDQNINKNKG